MSNNTGLDFERPILELEKKIEELRSLSAGEIDFTAEIKSLQSKLDKARRKVFKSLTAWQKVQIARHPQRPYMLDYVGLIFEEFIELSGDRCYADDKALIGGFATLDGERVMILGHQKGRDTKENLMRNFGSAHPEGYRKALRLMRLAEKFSIPILTFVDTPGAYPGIGAEERGQAEAIAVNLREMMALRTPVIVTIIGEGGSGGALGIGIGDRVIMLENAYYSVISPEGCAAILWKDKARAADAAVALKLTSRDQLGLGLVDEIVPEPLGGAHRDPEAVAAALKERLITNLKELTLLPPEELLEKRYRKFRCMGVFEEGIEE
ncbi:MAG: acetyl-CoA carboxylase carboxyltransferase subunit alpha [Candidatus Tritonobacter lacicola]|nr:acetyl-CoA carboxylase carboxyltransferase subunit alpha [Candidatus Tritonobacter lacicola]